MMLTLTMLDNFMYYTLPQFSSIGFHLLECIYIVENTTDPDQLKPADLDLHCFQNRNISISMAMIISDNKMLENITFVFKYGK